ncbi:hypothetical protein KA005_30225, partial [bacterium]|nr:hypothetical protein [bacterium]
LKPCLIDYVPNGLARFYLNPCQITNRNIKNFGPAFFCTKIAESLLSGYHYLKHFLVMTKALFLKPEKIQD